MHAQSYCRPFFFLLLESFVVALARSLVETSRKACEYPQKKPLYLSPRLIVMQVHQTAWGLFNLPGVHKAARELNAVLDVSRASSPFPAFLLIVIPLLLPVAAALAQVALAARRRDGVGNTCCRDGVGECCFSTA